MSSNCYLSVVYKEIESNFLFEPTNKSKNSLPPLNSNKYKYKKPREKGYYSLILTKDSNESTLF